MVHELKSIYYFQNVKNIYFSEALVFLLLVLCLSIGDRLQ